MELVDNNHSLKDVIFEVAEIAEYLWQRGWAERNAGNISVNVTKLIDNGVSTLTGFPSFDLPVAYPGLGGMYFFVSGTGKRMRDLAREPLKNAMIIKMNELGTAYQIISREKDMVTNFKPTSELPTHLGIHLMINNRGTKEKVVIHTHANELVALTQIKKYCDQERLNKLLWGMHPETVVFIPDGVGFVPYVTPGTQQIAAETIMALEKHQVALWEKHGVFAIGETVFDTFDLIDILVKSAKIYFMAKSSGHEPQGLSQDQLDILRELSQNF
ncbi:MAG TPA: rhamnulose-1-phosphate aldolase [Bacteroidales bacterium]|nr:rhamnulose-1-phosphate aldolase [Bacteroidales bacterium]